MVGFVDLHCHTLFRLDDGARDEEIMKSMLETAYKDGIRHICFTPHFKIYEFDSEESIYIHMQRIKKRYDVACEYTKANYPNLELYLGNEIMYHNDIADSLSSKKCSFLGDSSYALVEFEPNCSAYEIENSILRLLRKGIRPLIAHIERYSAINKDPSLLTTLKEHGALLQVNARSVTRFKFGKIARLLKNAFKKGLVDVVASDAHNNSSLPPRLSEAYKHIAKNYGESYADKIFHDVPLAIVSCKNTFKE